MRWGGPWFRLCVVVCDLVNGIVASGFLSGRRGKLQGTMKGKED